MLLAAVGAGMALSLQSCDMLGFAVSDGPGGPYVTTSVGANLGPTPPPPPPQPGEPMDPGMGPGWSLGHGGIPGGPGVPF